MEKQNIPTVPNQWTIIVKKEDTKIKRNNPFIIHDWIAEDKALRLDARAYKLWGIMARNKNNFQFALSPSYIQEKYNMNKYQYNIAKKILIDNKYLIKIAKNQYIFYERPNLGGIRL